MGNGNHARWAAREGDWKILGKTRETVRPEGIPELSEEDKELFLVDLKSDPGETTNLRTEHPEVVERLLEIREKYEADFPE
jgi:hypothetical protein